MNLRLSIVLIIFLSMVAGWVFFYELNRPGEPTEEPPWFYLADMLDITRIEVEHQGEKQAFVLGEDEQWHFDDAQKTPVFQDRWGGIVLLLSGPKSTRLLGEPPEDLAPFGLDSPQGTIRVSLTEGRELTILMGNKTPDGVSQYTQLVGYPDVFLVDSTWGDVIARLVTEPPYIPTPTPTITPTPEGTPEVTPDVTPTASITQ